VYYTDRPRDFFVGRDAEYDRRVAEGRFRVIEAFRFASVPLSGRGMCHEVRGIGTTGEHLTNFVDTYDSRRIKEVRKQRAVDGVEGLVSLDWRRSSPQNITRRRSGLFSGSDVTRGFFYHKGVHDVSKQERAGFVDLMRWYVLQDAIQLMIDKQEISVINDVWYIKVSVLDAHAPARRQRRHKSQQSSKRVKQDDRSFHGRPNRDRVRTAA